MRKTVIVLTIVVGLAGGACGGAEPVDGPATKPEPQAETELTLVATDFEFDLGGVESIPPGEVQLTLDNRGDQAHEAQLYLLNEGITYEQFTAATAGGESTRLPAEALAMATPAGGLTSNVTAGESITLPEQVAAGTYAFVCHLLDPESLRPHYLDGMIAPLEVR